LAFHYLARRERWLLELMAGFAAVLVWSLIYNHVLAPVLTLALNQYWPDFHYQQMPWSDLVFQPGFYALSGLELYFDAVRFFIGNIPDWAAVVVVLILLWLTRPKRDKKPPLVYWGFFLTQTLLIWLLIVLMVLRHGGLLWPDVRRTYYFLPLV